MVELNSPHALFLLVLLPLVWYWYRRHGLRERPATALWLIERGKRRYRRRRRLDLRLLALLTSLLLVILALSGPSLKLTGSGKLVVVIDASGSMAARDRNGKSRLDAAKERAAKLLAKSDEAVLVRAGMKPRAFGPTKGTALLAELEKIRAGDSAADLEAATALGRRMLPRAPVLVVSDAPPPDSCDGYLNVAGNGQNAGITALGTDFAVVFNAGPALWKGRLQSEGESYELQIPPQQYAVVRFGEQVDSRRARIGGGDVLSLDDLAFYESPSAIVELRAPSPELERALLAVGARPGTGSPLAVITSGTPPATPGTRPTAYFASEYGQAVTAADVVPTDPLTRGVNLAGVTLHPPAPPPGSGWRALARDSSGRPLLWRRGEELYLPPAADWKNQPALVVLLYNWLTPLANRNLPLGTDGVLRPSLRAGKAYSLASATETNLPRPGPDRPRITLAARDVSGWLAMLAGLLLILAGRLKVPAKNG
ncbi:vWA domain-containing protein [Oceanithermus sp.]